MTVTLGPPSTKFHDERDVAPAVVADAVADLASSKYDQETSARADLLAGKSVRSVWDTYRVF